MTQNWYYNYTPPEQSLWQGRLDSMPQERYFQIVNWLDLRNPLPNQCKHTPIVLLGFACDEGIKRNLGRPGAYLGPQTLRKELAKLPIHFNNQIMLFDAGDIVCIDNNLEQAQSALAHCIQLLHQHGMQTIVLGGGHETAWGHYQGLSQAYPNQEFGIINFDAHYDLRPLLADDKGSSGTPFLQIANACQAANLGFNYLCLGIQATANTESLYKTARNLKVTSVFAELFHQQKTVEIIAIIDKFMSQNKRLYLSFCLDVCSASNAPGVSAPQVLGVLPQQLLHIFKYIVSKNKIASFDIVELSPPLDQLDKTAKLAALFVSEYIHNLQV